MDEYNGVRLLYLIFYFIKKNSSNLQTLFKLHLRTEQQASQSTIYRIWFNREQIKGVIRDFKKRAQYSLFFIPIERISASYPGQHNYQESWVVEKSMADLPGFGEVTGIHHHHSSLQSKLEQWRVLFKTIPFQDIPHDFHECLSTHKIQTISIGIVGALNTSPARHRPFSSLPLLDTISLPIHLHCTFILSDDRRSIRYDEKGTGNPESQFNKWLLTEKVPPFYLQFLAGWNHAHPMKECPWWPKGGGGDTISRVVVKSMEAILPNSDEEVCDTFSGHRIAPSKAHFLRSPCPGGLLKKLPPADLAIIPPGFSHLPSPPLQDVESSYLMTVLRSKASSIISMYKEGKITVDDVVEVASFLKLPSLHDSLGLPLLPLADGTLALLSAGHTTLYCPPRKHETPWLPFPPHHFLDPKAAKTKDIRAIYGSLQVHDPDSMAVSRLITDKIPEQDSFPSSPDLELWLEELWELLDATKIEIEDPALQKLPLIPTYNPAAPTRISFQKLTGGKVVLNPPKNTPLGACVTLGMTLAKASDCRPGLREVIRSRAERSLGIHRTIIHFFMDLPSGQIPHHFKRLSHQLHLEFSQWFRGELSGSYYSLPEVENAIVQQLPLWEPVQVGLGPARFVSTSAALMIPRGVSPDVVRMWPKGSTVYVPADPLLTLMGEPVTLPSFYTDHLSFPPVMNPVTPIYESLLRGVLRSPNPRPSILVPNANGRMSSPSELYLSSNATFADGFASNRAKFLHPDLRHLEEQLCDWGLINTITTTSFRACASAIHQDARRAGILTRALTVFRTYNTEMPRKLLGDRGSQNALRNLRFIPRSVDSTRYGSILADGYHSLPGIVSPSEILAPKFVNVAWTQRATCQEEPSDELLLVNTSVWEPTVSEVVSVSFLFLVRHSLSTICAQIKHLHVLSTEIAPDLHYNSGLVEDLKATYSWLADHGSEADELLDYNQDKLFLNVDNPASEWRWYSASELLFDERDSSNPRRVRQFLRNFSGLLRAAGVKEINHVSIPDNLLREDSHETQLTQIKSSFNKMREADKLTDVTLTAKDGTEFPAHRVFLAARSEWFETCFAGGWSESEDLKSNVTADGSRECVGAILGS